MSRLSTVLAHIARDTRGVTAIEYGLLAGLVAVASVQAMGGLGDVLDASFGGAASQVSEPAPAGIPAPGGAGAPDTPTDPTAPSDPTSPTAPTGSSGGEPGTTAPEVPTVGDPLYDPNAGSTGNGNATTTSGGDTSGGAYEPPIAAASLPDSGGQ